ncbi:hypothetical protein [Verrucosispora sp. NA02020]|uniref:hypothetical protein n=1 Tax=Verrucosispora sp. NA02020 TaxID=2742132 RepID=UPI001590CFAA|nr:hypothetical protein [Verrucosispora sp. NA02020]QKW15311.1 hypothetical protein HUT12_22830 [Verrucosispora sp. NA02020]
MSAFNPDAVPTFPEAETRDSREEWERLERRRFRLFFAVVASVAVVVVAAGVWAISNGHVPWVGVR